MPSLVWFNEEIGPKIIIAGLLHSVEVRDTKEWVLNIYSMSKQRMTVQESHALSSGVPVSCLFITERPGTRHLIVLVLHFLIWKIGPMRLSNSRQWCKSLLKYRFIINLSFKVILRPCFIIKCVLELTYKWEFERRQAWGWVFATGSWEKAPALSSNGGCFPRS